MIEYCYSRTTNTNTKLSDTTVRRLMTQRNKSVNPATAFTHVLLRHCCLHHLIISLRQLEENKSDRVERCSSECGVQPKGCVWVCVVPGGPGDGDPVGGVDVEGEHVGDQASLLDRRCAAVTLRRRVEVGVKCAAVQLHQIQDGCRQLLHHFLCETIYDVMFLFP